MRIRFAVLARSSLPVLLFPLRLFAQGVEAELLGSDRAASALSSDSGFATALTRSLARDGVLLWPGAPVVIGADEAKRLMLTMPARGHPPASRHPPRPDPRAGNWACRPLRGVRYGLCAAGW